MTARRGYKPAKGHVESNSSKVMIVARLHPSHFKAVTEYAFKRGKSASNVIAACVAKCIEDGYLSAPIPAPSPRPVPSEKRAINKARACIAAWNDMPSGTYTMEDVAERAQNFWHKPVFRIDARNAYDRYPELFKGAIFAKGKNGRVTLTKKTSDATT